MARYLLKKYNLPYENLVSHREVSSTDCPKWIYDNNLWTYFKTEVKKRNDERVDLRFDTSLLDNGSGSGVNNNTSPNNNNNNMVNFDNRDDWTNIKEVKGITLVCMPPFHFTTIATREEQWSKMEYKKKFHYIFDGN